MIFSQNFKNIPIIKISSQSRRIVENLQDKIKNKELPQIDAIFNQSDLKEFEKLSKEISSYKKILVLGVGGSSLGGKTLTALKFQNKLEFLESIDPSTIKNSLDNLDLKNTFFLVISKSGETIETICQTLIIINILKAKKVKNFAKQFLFVTESKNNSIAKIATEIGAKIANHPQNIGGRFSCFSIVGMLPALLAGLDVKKIRLGAKKVIEEFLDDNRPILRVCAMQLDLYNNGFKSNVIMPYIDSLKNFTDWYRQLWAESLGKKGFGSVPINSMGTVDQHSQLQLYLEGPKDKFFTFVIAKKTTDNFLIKDLKTKTLFGGKKLSDIVKVEHDTTIEMLNRKKLPIRIFQVEKLNEEVLGALMMQMFLEVILISDLKNINPFDQPAVELRKDLAKKILK